MWHVSHGDKNFGPFAEDKMRALIKAGKLPPTVYVWKDGMADWVLLRDSPLMQAPTAAPPVLNAVPPVMAAPAAANPFDFSKPAARQASPGGEFNFAAAPQPSAQQLANPYFSDYQGGAAAPVAAAAAANPNFRLLKLEGLQWFTVITTGIAAVMCLVCGWLTFQQVRLAKRVVSGAYANNRGTAMIELQASDDRFIMAFLILLGVLLLMTIAFLLWFYRAHVNARAMSTAKFADSSGMAVGWFFIPILNLFKPYVGMRDIWRGSFSAPGSYASAPSTLVALWWGASIAANLLNRVVVMRFDSAMTTVDGKLMLFYISAFGYILQVLPFVLTIVLVTKITKQQARKAQQISRGVTAAAAPQAQAAPQALFGQINI